MSVKPQISRIADFNTLLGTFVIDNWDGKKIWFNETDDNDNNFNTLIR